MLQADQYKHQYTYAILEALHLQMDSFMYNLVYCQPYEMIIYHWIMTLYDKGVSKESAIGVIYKARNLYILKKQNCQP